MPVSAWFSWVNADHFTIDETLALKVHQNVFQSHISVSSRYSKGPVTFMNFRGPTTGLGAKSHLGSCHLTARQAWRESA